MPPRRALRYTVVLVLWAVLWLGSGRSLAAGAGAPQWQAVLVAGDDAQPVFDNAVEAVARWLADRGVPAADIHRLSASRALRDSSVAPGVAPSVEPGVEPASAGRILRRIASLRTRPGAGCLVFITSHGRRAEGIWLALSGEHLRPARLAEALSVGCAAVPTVVILSACYSGAFTVGAMRAQNRIILSAARADRASFGCQADRTYTVFDECLLAALPRAATWRAVYAASRGCVRAREQQLSVLPSQPQAWFGAEIRDLPVR